MPNRLAAILADTSGKITSYEQLKEKIMQIQTVQGLTQRQQFVEFYRGQGSDTFKLVNGIGRTSLEKEEIHRRESETLASFFDGVDGSLAGSIQHPPHGVDKKWFAYFQAQHLGLKTRLMDWTMKWPVALLFAVNEPKHDSEDGQFWVFMCPRDQVLRNSELDALSGYKSPPEVNQNYMINCPFYLPSEGEDFIAEKRRLRQHGRFFIQPSSDSTIPLEEQPELSPFLHKFIIDKAYKESLRQELGNFTSDWAYYRQDEDINQNITALNNLFDKLP